MLIVEADMNVQGRLTIVGTVRLDGRFDGTLVCSRLEIGTDGYLLGEVVTGELIVAGQIVGRAQARHIHLLASAIVEGELRHEQLQMDAEAVLVGESRRHPRLEMPTEFLALEARARHAEDDFLRLETESRVKRAEEALNAKAQFAALRARFPARRAQV
jgi:cytoskeletal protein CcmA (bactofilin family)